MSMTEPQIKDPESLRARWLEHLNALVTLVRGWVEPAGWQTRQITKPVSEPGLGRYEVPFLLMKRGDVEVVLSPVARTVPGADGPVELYLMPAYDDVVSLYFEGGEWFLHDAFPPDPTAPRSVIETDRLPLAEDTINRVLDAVSANA